MAQRIRAAIVIASSLVASPLVAAPFLFATSASGGGIEVIDVGAGVHVGNLPVGSVPVALALHPDGTRLYVVDAATDQLVVMSTVTGATTPVAVGDGPSAVALDPAGGRVYVTNALDDTLTVLDTVGLGVVTTVAVGDAPSAVAADALRAYVVNFGGDTLSIVDAASFVTSTVAVGPLAMAVAVNPAGTRAWVANLGGDSVTPVDLPAGTAGAPIPVGDAPTAVTVSPAGDRVYVANTNASSITVLDAATNAVLATFPTPGADPVDVEVSAAGDLLYVAQVTVPELTVLNSASGVAVGSIEVPEGLLRLAGFSVTAPQSVVEIPVLGPAGFVILCSLLLAAGLATLRRRRAGGLVASLLLLAAAGTPAAHAQDIVLADDDFQDSDWEIAEVIGTGTHTAARSVSSGSDGGPFRRMLHESFAAGEGGSIHRQTSAGFVYNPAASGALQSIDVSWMSLPETWDAGEDPMEEHFVVFQGTETFVAAGSTGQIFQGEGWEPFTASGLTASGFTASGGGNPDFSAAGAPLRFGYVRRRAASGFIEHGIDKFQVTLHRDGEPPPPGVLRFAQRTWIVTTGTIEIVVERVGGSAGAVTAVVEIDRPATGNSVVTLTWADGDAAPQGFTAPPADFGDPGDLSLSDMEVSVTVGEAQPDPVLRFAVLAVGPDAGLFFLLEFLRLALAAWEPLALVVLGLAALLVARRRHRRRPA